jgi:hypothetical protein
MHGEETGRLCRHEVSGLPARSNRGLSIKQVDGVNAMGVHRPGQMNRNTLESSDLEPSFLLARHLAKHTQKILAQDRHQGAFPVFAFQPRIALPSRTGNGCARWESASRGVGTPSNCSQPDSCTQAHIGKQAGPMGSKDL